MLKKTCLGCMVAIESHMGNSVAPQAPAMAATNDSDTSARKCTHIAHAFKTKKNYRCLTYRVTNALQMRRLLSRRSTEENMCCSNKRVLVSSRCVYCVNRGTLLQAG